MRAYYNENDPYAAQWLRNLVAGGHIAAGDVDDRSIVDVQAGDLGGYTQCHFFAGIGGWSLALRLSLWPDTRPVWTGSCPCQPFSHAGRQQGEADKRHLWPEFRRLIAECRPPVVFGEQVASSLGRDWLAGVRADLEELEYAVGAADLCAASAGAPHIRQRLWWVGQSYGTGPFSRRQATTPLGHGGTAEPTGAIADRLADADQGQRRWLADGERRQRDGQAAGWQQGDGVAQSGGDTGGLADAGRAGDERRGRSSETPSSAGTHEGEAQQRQWRWPDAGDRSATGGLGEPGEPRLEGRDARALGQQRPAIERTGSLPDGVGDATRSRCEGRNGTGEPEQGPGTGCPPGWSSYDIVHCIDGKARRTEPSIQPLAHAGEWGTGSRVGILRGAGNAIVAQVGATFISAWMKS